MLNFFFPPETGKVKVANTEKQVCELFRTYLVERKGEPCPKIYNVLSDFIMSTAVY